MKSLSIAFLCAAWVVAGSGVTPVLAVASPPVASESSPQGKSLGMARLAKFQAAVEAGQSDRILALAPEVRATLWRAIGEAVEAKDLESTIELANVLSWVEATVQTSSTGPSPR